MNLLVWRLATFTLLILSCAAFHNHVELFPPVHHRQRVSTSSNRVASLFVASAAVAADQQIGLWTAAFAASHIGMSAIRRDIIYVFGKFADEKLHIVNRWTLPDTWPGDEAGQSLFPTAETAGRQLYRIFYTMVSFVTLGSAFGTYLEALRDASPAMVLSPMEQEHNVYFWVSVLSSAASITSLVNPSPFSLVPVFETVATTKETSNRRDKDSTPRSNTIQRNDDQKLQPRGLTRITRHPLILPVVPWGIGTALSLGGQPREWILWGGLAMYAIVGCAAQDVRVLRQEGSLGTVFRPDDRLQLFFNDTSFVPFGAVVDGRQSLVSIGTEIPWWSFAASIGVGYSLQSWFLRWLVGG